MKKAGAKTHNMKADLNRDPRKFPLINLAGVAGAEGLAAVDRASRQILAMSKKYKAHRKKKS